MSWNVYLKIGVGIHVRVYYISCLMSPVSTILYSFAQFTID